MQVSTLETFFRESLSKQATIMLGFPCSEGDADGTGPTYLVKDNKVEMETSIEKVVEFWLRRGYPPFRWLSSVKRVSAWQRVVILNYRESGDSQEGVWYSVG